MEPHSLSIILPAYNEERNLNACLNDLIGCVGDNAEIIVVNDGSTDQTSRILEVWQHRQKNIAVINHEQNRGKGEALRTGVSKAQGEMIAFLDADGDIPASECNRLVEYLKINPNADVVIGSKRLKTSACNRFSSRYRRGLAEAGNWLIRSLLVKGVRDTQAGCKVFRASALAGVIEKTTLSRWSFDVELLFLMQKEDRSIHEVGIRWSETGLSHVRVWDYGRTLIDVLCLWGRSVRRKKSSGFRG